MQTEEKNMECHGRYDSGVIYKILADPMLLQDERELNTGHGVHWFPELFVSASFLINSSTASESITTATTETILRIDRMKAWVDLKNKENWKASKPRLICWQDPAISFFLWRLRKRRLHNYIRNCGKISVGKDNENKGPAKISLYRVLKSFSDLVHI